MQPRGGTATAQDRRGSGVFQPPCSQGLSSQPETSLRLSAMKARVLPLGQLGVPQTVGLLGVLAI